NTETKVQIDRASTRTDCRAEEAVSMVFKLENSPVHLSALRVDGQRRKDFPERRRAGVPSMRSRCRLRPVSESPRHGTSGGGRQRGSDSRPVRKKRTDQANGRSNEQVLEQPPAQSGATAGTGGC